MKTANLSWAWQKSARFPGLTRNINILFSLDLSNKQLNYCTKRERGEKATESFAESSRLLICGASSCCMPAARATALIVTATHNSATAIRSASFFQAESTYSRDQHAIHALQNSTRQLFVSNPSSLTNLNSPPESTSNVALAHSTWFETFVSTAQMDLGSNRVNSLSTS